MLVSAIIGAGMAREAGGSSPPTVAGMGCGPCCYVDGGRSLVALPPYGDLVERLLRATMSPAS